MEKRDRFLTVGPLTPQDVDEVSELYAQVFRAGHKSDLAEISGYIRKVFLNRETTSAQGESVLCRDSQGVVAAAVLALPMKITCFNDVITARLLCCLMKNAQSSQANAAIYQLCVAMHPRSQDFCFTDTAAPRSIEFVRTGGGEMLPFQTMNWRRVFRPLSFIVSRRFRHSGVFAPLIRLSARIGDLFVRNIIQGLSAAPADELSVKPIETEEFRSIAEELTSRFSIRPTWDKEEFAWLVAAAIANPVLGSMSVRAVLDREGKVAGAYLYFLDNHGLARVFHVVHQKEKAAGVLKCLFAELDEAGAYAATGMAQTDLLIPLSRESRVSYRYRGGFCVLSKHAHVIDALRRNDVYLGGFYSESWNRLAMDFG
ncbi:MAG: hypothetical protein IE937_12290 [Gammaproteobacteria bacterium]|nr:hypothetical protein [Gammaproteobacteria bacterium]